MKFFSAQNDKIHPGAKKNIIPNLLMILAAILCAGLMWYYVSIGKTIETQLEIGVDYKNIPPNLVVTEGLVPRITVRLNGPERLLKSLSKEKFNSRIVDLSNIKKGENSIPFGGEKLDGPYRAFDVVDIQPPKLIIKADNLVERSVPLTPIVDSPLGRDLTVDNVTTSPGSVIIRGPEEAVADLPSIKVTVRPNTTTSGVRQEVEATLDTPSLVTATPSTVKVYYTVTSERKVISRTYSINVADDTNHLYTVTPSEVNVMIEVPDALSKNSKYLKGLELEVVPPPMKDGESKSVRIKMRVPEGMSVLSHQQMEVVLSKKEKK